MTRAPSQLDPVLAVGTRATPRVLIVEDEPRLRELLGDVVPDIGFDAVAVRTGEEALRAMAVDPRQILLLDLHLPGMGGMDVFAEVRQRWPDTQVIILTAYGDLAAAQGAIRLGVADFLTKPFHLNDVEAALDRARQRLAARPQPTEASSPAASTPLTLADAERAAIVAALARHGGNRTAAAAELGISRRKLHYWLSENHVDLP